MCDDWLSVDTSQPPAAWVRVGPVAKTPGRTSFSREPASRAGSSSVRKPIADRDKLVQIESRVFGRRPRLTEER
jgi:hypothetical protein